MHEAAATFAVFPVFANEAAMLDSPVAFHAG
jgi:hypothetical protein